MSYGTDDITEDEAIDIAAEIAEEIRWRCILPDGLEAGVTVDDYDRVIVEIIIRS